MNLKCLDPGYDGICIKDIKQTSTVLSQALAHVVNLSFHKAIFPDKLKTVKLYQFIKAAISSWCPTIAQYVFNPALAE